MYIHGVHIAKINHIYLELNRRRHGCKVFYIYLCLFLVSQVQARKKVAVTVITFVFIFAFCFFPYHLFMMWFYFRWVSVSARVLCQLALCPTRRYPRYHVHINNRQRINNWTLLWHIGEDCRLINRLGDKIKYTKSRTLVSTTYRFSFKLMAFLPPPAAHNAHAFVTCPLEQITSHATDAFCSEKTCVSI